MHSEPHSLEVLEHHGVVAQVNHLNGVVVTAGEVGEVAGRADPQHGVTVA